ncbi:MAG: hypothetical protein R3A46_05710 [Thermomicrobiales bacterium]
MMKKIQRMVRSGRFLAVAALFGLAATVLVALPLVASADESDGGAPNTPPLSVEDCRDRAGGDHPFRDEFMDELVADAVITADQAAEIGARLDDHRVEACIGRIVFERGNAIRSTASVTGTEPREVLGAIVSGQSLSQFANDHGIDDSTLIEAIMEEPTAKAAELVSSGELSQAEADQILSAIEERVTVMIQKTDISPRRFRGA